MWFGKNYGPCGRKVKVGLFVFPGQCDLHGRSFAEVKDASEQPLSYHDGLLPGNANGRGFSFLKKYKKSREGSASLLFSTCINAVVTTL